jgi:hypothetical protein
MGDRLQILIDHLDIMTVSSWIFQEQLSFIKIAPYTFGSWALPTLLFYSVDLETLIFPQITISSKTSVYIINSC